ncbi:hypothetical protein [Nocardiopsis alba]|uniref:hypothetical protein n=1 Tax=Nocardiopsis alba TaxID=53437 RepID=UPI0018FEF13D|nr:hypothetical protein [Nocardiopsis alba]
MLSFELLEPLCRALASLMTGPGEHLVENRRNGLIRIQELTVIADPVHPRKDLRKMVEQTLGHRGLVILVDLGFSVGRPSPSEEVATPRGRTPACGYIADSPSAEEVSRWESAACRRLSRATHMNIGVYQSSSAARA